MLVEASNNLPSHLRLVVRAGHRPLSVQKRVFDDLKDEYLVKNSQATDEQAITYARTFVSDPLQKRPPHCCGAAADVDVYDTLQNKYVDFGSRMNTDSEISYLHTNSINDAATKNRQMLLRAMLVAGFASDPFEWWHFSYGDQNWAWFYGHNKSLYNMIEPTL
jgi:zinc D-Ala-D-Ala dipeptidase